MILAFTKMSEPSTHQRTQSDNISRGLVPRHTTQPLLCVVDTLRELVNGDSFGNVATISQEMASFKAAIEKHDDEIRSVRSQCDHTVQKILSLHYEELSKAKLEQESTNQDLTAARSDNERNQKEIAALKKANAELEKQSVRLSQTQKEVKDLLQKINEKDDKIQQDKTMLDEQKQVISNHRTQLDDAAKKSEILTKDLEEYKADLRRIQNFAPSLIEDEVDQV